MSMSAPAARLQPGRAGRQPRLWQVVSAAFGVQSLFFMIATAPAVYAPKVAPELGIGPEWVGMLFAMSAFSGVTFTSASSALYARFGMIRVLQIAALSLCGALLIGYTAIPWIILLAGLLIGAAQGPAGPACTYLISKYAPPSQLGLLTSMQQAGAPMGLAVGGIIIPALILLLGWRWSLAVLALPCVAVALMLEGLRRPIDAQVRTGATPTLKDMVQPLRLVLGDPRLRQMCVIGSALIMLHQGFIGFLIIYLSVELNLDLVQAGAIMAAAQIAAIAARLMWGWLGDRTRDAFLILAIAALGSALCNTALVLYPMGWPLWPVVVLSLLLGVTSAGWQGLFFAANARTAPPDKVVSALSGVAFFMFAAGGLGPMLIAGIISATSSYRIAYGLLAVLALWIGTRLLRQRSAHHFGRA
jgi:MFS family permease